MRNVLSVVLIVWCFGPAGSTDQRVPLVHSKAQSAVRQPARFVTIDAVGDVMLGSGVADLVRRAGPDAPFAHIKPILRESDAVVGNLECSLSTHGSPTAAKKPSAVRAGKEWLLRGAPEAALGLKDAGFAALSVANNHTMDYGPLALRDTLVTLRSNGIGSAGAGENLAEAWRPAFFDRAGVRFALIAVSDILPRGFAADRHRPGVAPGRSLSSGAVDAPSIAAMSDAVRAARQEADVVIVYEHWGEALIANPTLEQRAAAHAAIDAGALVVFGSHSHVLGPIEPYRGGLIAYSLGNFVFDTYPGPGARSEVLALKFRGRDLTSWRAVPATIVGGAPEPGPYWSK